MTDLFPELPDNAEVDENLVKEAKASVKEMGKSLLIGKMEEAKILQESIKDGGPGSAHEALFSLMNYTNTGFRALAVKAKVSRKKLVRMMEGHTDMDPEVFSKISDVLLDRYNKLQKKNAQGSLL